MPRSRFLIDAQVFKAALMVLPHQQCLSHVGFPKSRFLAPFILYLVLLGQWFLLVLLSLIFCCTALGLTFRLHPLSNHRSTIKGAQRVFNIC